MKNLKVLLENEIKTVINEAVKVNYKDHKFILKVDVNEDPTKKGIKVQFIPTTFGSLSPVEQDDIAIDLGHKLESGLKKYGLGIERDRNLKDKTIVGFFIYIEYISRLVRNALTDQEEQSQI